MSPRPAAATVDPAATAADLRSATDALGGEAGEAGGGGEAEVRRIFARLAGDDPAGRGRALAALYDLAAAGLYGQALWRTGSEGDAADAVQEVFVKLAATRPAVLARVRRPAAYLRSMTHRAAIDQLRRRRPHAALDGLVIAADDADPGSAVDSGRLSALVHRLPPAQREALYLRQFAGLTYAAVGRATGVPTFTAAARCRLGLARLRRLMRIPS